MGKLFVVGTPIGNLNDITKRQLDTLKSVDIILCEDTRHSLKLLNYYQIRNKLISYHKFNEKEKTPYLIKELIDNNKNIALITDAGMPCISDPGYVLVNKARENNIEVIGVGGISAVTTSLSVSGLDCKNFSFYGFFPRENKDKKNIIKEIKQSLINVFVFYESPKRIISTLEYLKEELGSFNICVCSDLTKIHEKTYYGNIDKILNELKNNDKSELGEYTFIIEKLEKEEIKKEEISTEALLIDTMIKYNISMKDAIEKLNEISDNLSKKDIYNASLNIKKIIG